MANFVGLGEAEKGVNKVGAMTFVTIAIILITFVLKTLYLTALLEIFVPISFLYRKIYTTKFIKLFARNLRIKAIVL